jgi:hypothetical protein
VSDWLHSCKGCGCAYIRSAATNTDFCQYCCEDIRRDPAGFKTLEQRNDEKALARAGQIMKRQAKRRLMENTVSTVEEAKEWFFKHHEGDVLAVKPNGEQKRFDNYPDAKAFLES